MRFGMAAEKLIVARKCKGSASQEGLNPNCGNSGYKDDPFGGTLYYTLKIGPLSLGTQATWEQPELQADSAVMNKRAIVAGGALTFGDTIALSYGTAWDRYKWNDANRCSKSNTSTIPKSGPNLDRADGGHLDWVGDDSGQYTMTRFYGWSASMNIGPVAIKGTTNKIAGHGENASSAPRKHSEINLSIAF